MWRSSCKMDKEPAFPGKPGTLHEILHGKGDYLFFEHNQLFLMENNVPREASFISLKPQEDWHSNLPEGKHLILSFELKEEDLNAETGVRILDFLSDLEKKNVRFRVSRALPRKIFARYQVSIFQRFGIPQSCRECLELFKISSNSNTVLCNGAIIKNFRFTKNGRTQVYEYLKVLHGESTIFPEQNRRFSFKILNALNCTRRDSAKIPHPAYFDFGAYWVSKMGWEPNWGLRRTIDRYREKFKGESLLDNGGAHGRDSFLFEEEGIKVVLTDLKELFFPYTLRRQEETGRHFPVLCSDSRQLPFKDRSFMGVYSGGVMHHEMTLNDVKCYIRESYRVLKYGGIFFGSVWAYWDFNYPPETALLQMRDKKVFEDLLRSASFELVEEIREFPSPNEQHKHMWEFICIKPTGAQDSGFPRNNI